MKNANLSCGFVSERFVEFVWLEPVVVLYVFRRLTLVDTLRDCSRRDAELPHDRTTKRNNRRYEQELSSRQRDPFKRGIISREPIGPKFNPLQMCKEHAMKDHLLCSRQLYNPAILLEKQLASTEAELVTQKELWKIEFRLRNFRRLTHVLEPHRVLRTQAAEDMDFDKIVERKATLTRPLDDRTEKGLAAMLEGVVLPPDPCCYCRGRNARRSRSAEAEGVRSR